jgi:ATP-dependent protease ClpP protease subunit
MKKLITGIITGLMIVLMGCTTRPVVYDNLMEESGVYQHVDDSVIYFGGNFQADSHIPFIYATTKNPAIKHYTIRINSNGGDAYACTIIANHIKKLQKQGIKFTMVVDGKAYSAGFFLFMLGDERIMSPGSLLMLHTMEAQKTSEGITIPDKHMAYVGYLDRNIVRMTYEAYPNVDRMTLETALEYSGQTFINADEAVELGLADRIEG